MSCSPAAKKKIALLGATGSIGTNTLQIIREHPDKFELFAVSTHTNTKKLSEIIEEFAPHYAVITGEIKFECEKCRILYGTDGLREVASHPDVDIVLVATLGTIGIFPTIEGLRSGKRIALANKETLVAFGSVVKRELENSRGELVPVDSEHSALFQLLNAWRGNAESIVLTASGGPLRKLPRKEMEKVTIEMVLNHPTWRMGKKITVDSATLMNKGLEVIEAHWLFGFTPEKIEVLIHPQSIIHGMLKLRDGAIVAHLSLPDMKIPIQYALTYPERIPSPVPTVNLAEISSLTFEEPDYERFPLLKVAYEVLKLGKGYPAVMNAANDEAVHAFLDGRISFISIEKVIKSVLDEFKGINESLEELLECDEWARLKAREIINSLV